MTAREIDCIKNNYYMRLKLCSIKLMQNDCETLKQLVLTKDPVFLLLSIPVYALFCNEAYSFLQLEFGSAGLEKEIVDIRNNLKRFSERYGKIVSNIEKSDEKQDGEFASKVKLKWITKKKLHANMGIYLSEDKKVIGNTQFIADINNLLYDDEENRRQKAYDLGEEMGATLTLFSKEIGRWIGEKRILIYAGKIISNYADINTNRNGFFSHSLSKEQNIFLLNILGTIGFTKYELEKRIDKYNPWMFRQKYIMTYYAYRGLDRLYNHCKMNGGEIKGISQLLISLEKHANNIFNPILRNCMMHYDLLSKGEPCINIEKFDEKTLYYGLIEANTNCQNYDVAYNVLSKIADSIETFIESIFDFSRLLIKQF